MKFKFSKEGDSQWDEIGEPETSGPMALSPSLGSPVAEVVAEGPPKMLKLRPPGYTSVIVLPVITSGSRDAARAWTWNGSLEKPTLHPSIRTDHGDGRISHLWLNDGMCQFLSDSTDGNAGKTLPLVCLENVDDRGGGGGPHCGGLSSLHPLAGSRSPELNESKEDECSIP